MNTRRTFIASLFGIPLAVKAMPEIKWEPPSNFTGWKSKLFPKQFEVFNERGRYVLATGARVSGKTTACLHSVVRHAWETDGARIAIFAPTIVCGNRTELWRQLTEEVIPEWNEGIGTSGFWYTTTPRVDGATRMSYLRLRNAIGTESEIQLHTVNYGSADLRERLLGHSYSMVFVSNLDWFDTAEEIFSATALCLCHPKLRFSDHRWLGDANVPDKPTKHWAYDLWFRNPKQDFALIEFRRGDNPSEGGEIPARTLKRIYRDDPEAYARFIEGKWSKTA